MADPGAAKTARTDLTEAPEYVLVLSGDETARYEAVAAAARDVERPAWERAGVVAGARVADVGCGPGAVSALLADEVGETGQVVALDADPVAVERTAELARARPDDTITTRIGRAEDTGLPEGTVDVAVLRYVLAHNGPRAQAIVDHLATRVRPGGSVYLLDVEATGLRRRPPDPVLAELEASYVELHRRLSNDVSIGLRLDELLRTAGLVVEEFAGGYTIMSQPREMRGPAWAARDALMTAGLADPTDLARWDAAFRTADPATLFVPWFRATGRRPQPHGERPPSVKTG